MPNRLTSAMEEAYAANAKEEVIYHTIELNHPAFATPARVVTPAEEDLNLPTVLGGTPVTFVACPFDITPPGFDEDGPTQGKLTVDNISSTLVPYLRQAITSAASITVIYRAYKSSVLTEPGDVIEGLQLSDVTLNATSAEGTIAFAETSLQAFPLKTYNLSDYPNVHR